MAYDVKLKYTDVFVADPKFVLDGERPEGAKENTALLESNKAWINDRSGKEVTKRMINVKNTMPITPHGVYKYVDDSPYCWVMFAYDSDEDVQSGIFKTRIRNLSKLARVESLPSAGLLAACQIFFLSCAPTLTWCTDCGPVCNG